MDTRFREVRTMEQNDSLYRVLASRPPSAQFGDGRGTVTEAVETSDDDRAAALFAEGTFSTP